MDRWVIVLIVLGGLALTAGLIAATVLSVRTANRRKFAELEQSGFQATRRSAARSFGVTSRGRGQVRGSGLLALGEDALVFVQQVPTRQVRVPLTDIIAIDTPRSHLGKTSGVRLLKVGWRSEGVEDSIGIEVRDLDGWIAAIEAARAERG